MAITVTVHWLGASVTRRPDVRQALGASGSEFDSWLQLRGGLTVYIDEQANTEGQHVEKASEDGNFKALEEKVGPGGCESGGGRMSCKKCGMRLLSSRRRLWELLCFHPEVLASLHPFAVEAMSGVKDCITSRANDI